MPSPVAHFEIRSADPDATRRSREAFRLDVLGRGISWASSRLAAPNCVPATCVLRRVAVIAADPNGFGSSSLQ
jgi:hypothetical protein